MTEMETNYLNGNPAGAESGCSWETLRRGCRTHTQAAGRADGVAVASGVGCKGAQLCGGVEPGGNAVQCGVRKASLLAYLDSSAITTPSARKCC